MSIYMGLVDIICRGLVDIIPQKYKLFLQSPHSTYQRPIQHELHSRLGVTELATPCSNASYMYSESALFECSFS
jgi:hypothetical protein